MRCPGGLIHIGQHRDQLIDACGDPDSKILLGEDRPNKRTRRIAEEWIYKNLGGCMLRIVHIQGSKVVKIESYKK